MVVQQLPSALLKQMNDTSAWVRQNPYQAAGILGGTILIILTIATPAILAAAGFGALGPVGGSLAAAWQASIGSVAAGSLFAILQSVAMGGAALGMLTGIGAVVGIGLIAVGLASSEGGPGKAVGEVMGKVKDFVHNGIMGKIVRKVQDFVRKEIVGGFFKNVKEFFVNMFDKEKSD